MPMYRLRGTNLEVCVARPPENTVEQPTIDEHAALDAFFALPENCNPETGVPYRLYGDEVPGVNGGVLMYPIPESE